MACRIRDMTKEEKVAEAASYVRSIMNPDDSSFPRLSCTPTNESRYKKLKATKSSALSLEIKDQGKIEHLFALDLYECAPIMPTLMGTIVQTMELLGPEGCALSVVEGRSRDSTYEVLDAMREYMERLGARCYLSTNDVDPEDGRDRILALLELQNQALEPLTKEADLFSWTQQSSS